MNCIDVSLKYLNEELNITLLKSENLKVSGFNVGDKLNTTIDLTNIPLRVQCSMVCENIID